MNQRTIKATVGLVTLALIAMGGFSVNAETNEKPRIEPVGVLEPIPTGNLGCPGLPLSSPVTLLLQTDQVEDVYCLEGSAGDVVTIRADTADATTAHDLWAGMCAGGKVFDLFLCNFFDDNFACTFPPPAYACPAGTVVLPADGTYTIFVGSWGVWGGAWAGPYLYNLEVTVNGEAANLDLNSFNQPQTGY